MKWKYIITLILFLSIAINIKAIHLLHASFIKLQSIRTFPSGYIGKNLTELKKTVNLNSITLLGDSRVLMWPQEKLTKEYSITNMAVGGQTSSQLVSQLNTNIPSKIAFVQTCINDLHWINLEHTLHEIIVEQCKSNIKKIVDTLHKRKITVILSTIIPPGRPSIFRKLYWPKNIENMLTEINDFILKQKSMNTIILDSEKILRESNSIYIQDQYLDSDFYLHINSAAYIKLSNSLNKILLKL